MHTTSDPTATPATSRPWRTIALACALFNVLGYITLGTGYLIANTVADNNLAEYLTSTDLDPTPAIERGMLILGISLALAMAIPLGVTRAYLTGKVTKPTSTTILGFVAFWIAILLSPFAAITLLAAPAAQFTVMTTYATTPQPPE